MRQITIPKNTTTNRLKQSNTTSSELSFRGVTSRRSKPLSNVINSENKISPDEKSPCFSRILDEQLSMDEKKPAICHELNGVSGFDKPKSIQALGFEVYTGPVLYKEKTSNGDIKSKLFCQNFPLEPKKESDFKSIFLQKKGAVCWLPKNEGKRVAATYFMQKSDESDRKSTMKVVNSAFAKQNITPCHIGMTGSDGNQTDGIEVELTTSDYQVYKNTVSGKAPYIEELSVTVAISDEDFKKTLPTFISPENKDYFILESEKEESVFYFAKDIADKKGYFLKDENFLDHPTEKNLNFQDKKSKSFITFYPYQIKEKCTEVTFLEKKAISLPKGEYVGFDPNRHFFTCKKRDEKGIRTVLYVNPAFISIEKEDFVQSKEDPVLNLTIDDAEEPAKFTPYIEKKTSEEDPSVDKCEKIANFLQCSIDRDSNVT